MSSSARRRRKADGQMRPAGSLQRVLQWKPYSMECGRTMAGMSKKLEMINIEPYIPELIGFLRMKED